MTDVSHIITQGLGTPAAIPQFILVGLSPVTVDIEFVNSSTTDSAGAQSVSPAIPTGSTTDDLMIAFCNAATLNLGGEATWDDDGGDSNGWIKLIQNYETTGRDTECAIYYKIHDGSESTPTFTRGGSDQPLTGTIVTFRNVDTTTPFDVTYNNSNHYLFTENETTPTNQPITTSTNNAWVVLLSAVTYSQISAVGAPANYDLQESIVNPDRNVGIATRTISSAGTETPGAWTNSGGSGGEESQCYTLALKPASGGGTPPGGNIIPIIVYHRMLQGIQ